MSNKPVHHEDGISKKAWADFFFMYFGIILLLISTSGLSFLLRRINNKALLIQLMVMVSAVTVTGIILILC